MKRVVKYCFLAALGLLIPGIVLCVLGTVAGGVWSEAFSRNNLISDAKPLWGWSWSDRDHQEWDDWEDWIWNWNRGPSDSAEKAPTLALSGSDSWQIPHETGEIRELDFDVQIGRLELTLGDGFALYSGGCDEVVVDSTKEDGVWKLRVWSDHDHGQKHGDGDTVEVVLPRDVWYETVELECSAGTITGEELACGNLEVDVQAGSVQLRRVQADSMELNADAGSVDVSGTVSNTARVEVNTGSVTLRTPRPEQYGYSMECSMGQVELFGEFSTSLYKRVTENENLRPFFDLEVNTGKAAIKADDTL